MTKYYKVIKETPTWGVGAILSNENSEDKNYSAIEDLWDNISLDFVVYEFKELVENSPKFFQRVYKSRTDKLVFLTKEQFKKAYKMLEA